MDLATISANGQIPVPADVRRALRLGPGDKIAFVMNELRDITVVKPLAAALIEAQRGFSGAAEEASLQTASRRGSLSCRSTYRASRVPNRVRRVLVDANVIVSALIFSCVCTGSRPLDGDRKRSTSADPMDP